MVAKQFYVVTKDWSFSVSQNSWNTIQFQCLFSLESWKQRQIQIQICFSFKIVIGLEWQSQPKRDICFHIQCSCSFNIFLQNGREIENYFLSKFDCKGKLEICLHVIFFVSTYRRTKIEKRYYFYLRFAAWCFS